MASIVKELDKVSGTTTRSHNIADAVSKLKMGGGSGGGTDIYIVEFGGTDGSTLTANKTRAEILQAFNESKIVLGFGKFDMDESSFAREYSFVSLINGVLSVKFNDILCANGSSESDSSTSWSEYKPPVHY